MPEDVNPYNAGVPPGGDFGAASAHAYPLSVDVEMEAEDVAAVFRSGSAIRPHLRRRRTLAYGLMLLGLLLGAGALLVPPQLAGRVGPALLFVAAISLFSRGGYLMAFGAAALRRNISQAVVRSYQEPRNARLLGWRRMSIDAEGVRQTSTLFEASWKWKAIDQIEVAADYLFLYVGSVQSLIIPQRAFHSDAHFQAFLCAVRDFHQQASEIRPEAGGERRGE